MRKNLPFVILILLIAGAVCFTNACAVETLFFQPVLIKDKDPKEIIRQVILEQPPKKVPKGVNVTEAYLEIDTTIIRMKGPVRRQKLTTITIYFNNVGSSSLIRTSNCNNDVHYCSTSAEIQIGKVCS